MGFCPLLELLSWTVSPRLKEQDTAGKIATFVWETTSDRRCWAQPGVPCLSGGGCWHSESFEHAAVPHCRRLPAGFTGSWQRESACLEPPPAARQPRPPLATSCAVTGAATRVRPHRA